MLNGWKLKKFLKNGDFFSKNQQKIDGERKIL